jgi:ribosomal protein S18 acetylase RimI-like enzyme
MLALAETVVGTTFRGAVQTGSYRWVAFEAADPVGYIDCGTCDRWTICDDGGDAEAVVRSVIDRPAASIALAVDPARRRSGIGRAMLRAALKRAEVRDVELFGAGVEPDNEASIRCFGAAGFLGQSVEPDWEHMLYFIRTR